MLTEWEVIAAVLEQHSASAAGKFIDEVCWRTYWKGWLERRPEIWENYLQERGKLLADFKTDRAYREAITGQTGIDCFDHWICELNDYGTLHNHARMWFASIWVHTLKLPWQLGADWFFRQLLDGDPASNTLSWRWIAGLQTLGKTYLARPDNIQKYTHGRFACSTPLATAPLPIPPDYIPAPEPMKTPEAPPHGTRIGSIVTDEDLSAIHWMHHSAEPNASAGFFSSAQYIALDVEHRVIQFRKDSLESTVPGPLLETDEDLLAWSIDQALDGLLIAVPTTGAATTGPLSDVPIKRYTARHWWDQHFYPQATHGFFRFKKAIPDAIERIQQLPQTAIP